MKLNAKWAKTRAQALGRELSENISGSKRNATATKLMASGLAAIRKNNAKLVKTRLSENIGGSKRNAIRKKNAYRFGLRAK